MGATQQPGAQNTAGIQLFQTVISSAQLLAANTSPIEIIPAPGAGKIVHIFGRPVFKNNFGGVAYANNTTPRIIYNAGNPLLMFSANVLLGFALDRVFVGSATLSADYSRLENQAVLVDVATGDPINGNGTLGVAFLFQILTI